MEEHEDLAEHEHETSTHGSCSESRVFRLLLLMLAMNCYIDLSVGASRKSGNVS